MSEHLAAEIVIGGTLQNKHVHRLCAAITAAGVELDWDGGRFQPRTAADLLKNCTERDGRPVVSLCDSAASWGRFEELETLLVRLRLPFDRFTEAKWEFDGEWAYYRPGSRRQALRTTAGYEPNVLASDLQPVLDALSQCVDAPAQSSAPDRMAAMRTAVRRLRRLVPQLPVPLPAFEIID